MSFSYSHNHQSGWIGRYDTPQQALGAGRAAYGSDTRIFIGRWQKAMFSDMFIGAEALLSYMMEDAALRVGDEHVEAFDNLPAEEVTRLDLFVRTAIGEFESDLPEELQFTGMHVEKVKGYSEHEEVRRGHFGA